MNHCSKSVQGNSKTKEIVLSGLFIGMVFIATMFINIRLPIAINGGLIHLGSAMVVIITLLFGRKYGTIAASFGMCFFDLLGGWVQWAPFTFLIKGSMAYLMGTIAYACGREGNDVLWNILGIVVGGIWMIVGYYVAEVILFGNWVAPITSIPGMAIQIFAAMLFGLPIATALKKTKIHI
ncbi:ECF transporter S component [Crassaminicella profunda]|uniref:ECF transporter S component n=1 Tax=Crassaminicella profunda TaxID=1286698 RepID=UPI001CA6737E|nr:ECF transporter S component [Crassaminicella profunda]QZY54873.1 ECF transporter S component [Crassaminicella profunda]